MHHFFSIYHNDIPFSIYIPFLKEYAIVIKWDRVQYEYNMSSDILASLFPIYLPLGEENKNKKYIHIVRETMR